MVLVAAAATAILHLISLAIVRRMHDKLLHFIAHHIFLLFLDFYVNNRSTQSIDRWRWENHAITRIIFDEFSDDDGVGLKHTASRWNCDCVHSAH